MREPKAEAVVFPPLSEVSRPRTPMQIVYNYRPNVSDIIR